MNEKDKAELLKDFKDADVQKKLDMWFYALEQEGLWGEILTEMSDIAQHLTRGQTVAAEE